MHPGYDFPPQMGQKASFLLRRIVDSIVIRVAVKRNKMEPRSSKWNQNSRGPKIDPCGTANDSGAEWDSIAIKASTKSPAACQVGSKRSNALTFYPVKCDSRWFIILLPWPSVENTHLLFLSLASPVVQLHNIQLSWNMEIYRSRFYEVMKSTLPAWRMARIKMSSCASPGAIASDLNLLIKVYYAIWCTYCKWKWNWDI